MILSIVKSTSLTTLAYLANGDWAEAELMNRNRLNQRDQRGEHDEVWNTSSAVGAIHHSFCVSVL